MVKIGGMSLAIGGHEFPSAFSVNGLSLWVHLPQDVGVSPVRGKDYPGTWAEFVAWFPDDAACAGYLEMLRWPDGFQCPVCDGTRAWRRSSGRWLCAGCRRETSVTAGTVFDRTRSPLTQWFAAAWHGCATKNGASALGLQTLFGLGSYETAWAWLHKLRRPWSSPAGTC